MERGPNPGSISGELDAPAQEVVRSHRSGDEGITVFPPCFGALHRSQDQPGIRQTKQVRSVECGAELRGRKVPPVARICVSHHLEGKHGHDGQGPGSRTSIGVAFNQVKEGQSHGGEHGEGTEESGQLSTDTSPAGNNRDLPLEAGAEVGTERSRVRIPAGRIPLQGLQDDAIDGSGESLRKVDDRPCPGQVPRPVPFLPSPLDRPTRGNRISGRDALPRLTRRESGKGNGSPSRDQPVEDQAELIDVGGKPHPTIFRLLRARPAQGQGTSSVAPRQFEIGFLMQHLRDPEIQELHPPFGSHQDVARLEVAMDDPPLMGVINGLAHLDHAGQSILQGGTHPGAVDINGLPIDVLHHDVGDTGRGNAPVQEPCDAGMTEGSQDLPLGQKTPFESPVAGAPGEELDGDTHLELAIRPLRQEDLTHASGADPPDQAVSPHHALLRKGIAEREVRAEEGSGIPGDLRKVFLRCAGCRQELHDLIPEAEVIPARRVNERCPVPGRLCPGPVDQITHLAPTRSLLRRYPMA
jgi:hypothetical protein